MAMFVSSAWGFSPESWAALGFTDEKTRNDLAAQWRDGDELLVIGTKGDETPVPEQGRLLGLITIVPTPLRTRDLVEPAVWTANLRAGQTPKWTFGLSYRSAERFVGTELPKVDDVLPRIYRANLGRKVARFYETLTDQEAQRVRNLQRAPVTEFYRSPVAQEADDLDAWRRRLGRLSRGPRPTVRDYAVELRDSPAFTYCFEFRGPVDLMLGLKPYQVGRKGLFKIGWSIDDVARLRAANSFFPAPEAAGWAPYLSILLPSRAHAYALEQRMLGALSSASQRGEIVFCDRPMIDATWNQALARPVTEAELSGIDLDGVALANLIA